MSTSQGEHPETAPTNRSLILILRAVCAFVLLGALIALLYWWGYNSYQDVAEWVEPGNHDALIYNGETYYLSGQIGKKGLSKSKYPIDRVLGQVKDDGVPVTTEPVTTAEAETKEEPWPEETQFEDETETELESVVPPAGAELFSNSKHAYILYSVEKNEQYLILLETDGQYDLYYNEAVSDPLASK